MHEVCDVYHEAETLLLSSDWHVISVKAHRSVGHLEGQPRRLDLLSNPM